MPNWREEINLNAAIAKASADYDLSRLEEPMPEPVKELLCAELSKSPWLSGFASRLRRAASIAEANRILEAAFDAADRHRVWCGMPGVT